MHRIAALAVGVSCLLAPHADAQGVRSLTDSEWTANPRRESPGSPLPLLEQNPAVLENVLLLRASVKELSQSLAIANAEAETFKRQAAELALRLDTLGLAELENNPAALEQKLLASVREARTQQKRAESLENALVDLSETVVTLLQQTHDVPADLRAEIETRIRRSNELLGALPGIAEAPAVEADLTNALVVDIKPELSLVVANVGTKNGVRIGTPFRIFRGSQPMATAITVDARERISGLIIQSLENENLPVLNGDRLRVLTSQ